MPPRAGIDLGGTKIQAVLVDERNDVLGSARCPTPTSGGPADVAREIELALRDACAAERLDPSSLAGVGVGSPGTIENGNVSSARNLPGWEGSFPLAAALETALGCRVRIGNDVQVATEAEFELGAGEPYSSLLGVFWGTGVGGGLILDGKPWRGRGGAGEIGHVVVKMDGARCTCGRIGCVEAYAGRASMEARVRRQHEKGRRTSLFRLMEEHNRTRLTSGIWARALEHGDKLASTAIDRAVQALAAGIASVVNVLDIEGVVIGGGLGVRFGDPCAKRIAQEMHPHLFIDSRPPAVHLAALGDLGGALGAALLVAEDRPPPAAGLSNSGARAGAAARRRAK